MAHGVALPRAVGRGFSRRCPRCGRGDIFVRYLKPAPTCGACGESYGEIRTDDIAPYFTILAVGHLIVPSLLLVEQFYAPPVWIHWLLWPPLTLLAALVVLPRIKGAVMGWMWWLGLRGDEQH
jgi:uncharacterized protein (DUF983 family)